MKEGANIICTVRKKNKLFANYIKNIKQDKQNKTLGEWLIKDEMIDILKYSYVYLVGSNQMIVKKYHIEKFEKSDPSKGYSDPDKKCFIFSKSEDLFVDFPGVVQARHYVHSSTLDNAQRISPDQVNIRMMNAKDSKSEGAKSKAQPLSARDKLVEVKNSLFKDNLSKFLLNSFNSHIKFLISIESQPLCKQ